MKFESSIENLVYQIKVFFYIKYLRYNWFISRNFIFHNEIYSYAWKPYINVSLLHYFFRANIIPAYLTYCELTDIFSRIFLNNFSVLLCKIEKEI